MLWAIGETLGPGVLEQDGAGIRLALNQAVDLHLLEDGLLLQSGSVAADPFVRGKITRASVDLA